MSASPVPQHVLVADPQAEELAHLIETDKGSDHKPQNDGSIRL